MTIEREDVLISRVVDGEASDADWRELESLAAEDGAVMRRLAEAQSQEAALREAMAGELARAEAVELPERHAATVYQFRSRLQGWTGWAAAAAVALAWATAGGALRGGGETNVAGASWGAPASTEEAFERYQLMGLAEGRVLGELPLVMLRAEQREDGQTDVTYLRRVLERKTVTGVYEPGVDADGRPALLPARLETSGDEPEAL
jgi:anti-sigma factor RsiW